MKKIAWKKNQVAPNEVLIKEFIKHFKRVIDVVKLLNHLYIQVLKKMLEDEMDIN